MKSNLLITKNIEEAWEKFGTNLKQTHQYSKSRKPNKMEPLAYFFKLEEAVKHLCEEVLAAYDEIMLVYQIRTHPLQIDSLKEHLLKENH